MDELPNGQLQLLDPPTGPTEGHELLTPEAEQRDLYPLTTVERNQERLAGIIRYLGAGVPKAEIIRTYRVGWHTLQRIAEQHGERIAEVKRRVATKVALLVDTTADSLLEDVIHGEMEPRDKAVLLGITVDKLQVLTGEPTVIHGSADAAKLWSVENLRARLAGVIDVSATGLVEPGNGQTREAPAGGEPAALVAAGAGDSQSLPR